MGQEGVNILRMTGDELRRVQEASGLTQDEFAEMKLNVSRTQLNRLFKLTEIPEGIEARIDLLKGIIRFILWPLHRGKFIILLSFSLNTYGQKLFINKSLTEAQDYWMEKTQPKFVHTEEYEDGTIAEIWVMKGDIGNPDFSALFDEKGKCVEQTVYRSNYPFLLSFYCRNP